MFFFKSPNFPKAKDNAKTLFPIFQDVRIKNYTLCFIGKNFNRFHKCMKSFFCLQKIPQNIFPPPTAKSERKRKIFAVKCKK